MVGFKNQPYIYCEMCTLLRSNQNNGNVTNMNFSPENVE